MRMSLKKYVGTSVLSAVLVLGSGIVAMAQSHHSKSVKFMRDVVVNGKTLSAGKYRVDWTTHSPEASIEFTHSHAVVASAEGIYVDRGQAYTRDMYVTDTAPDGTQVLREVRFAGSSKVLVFN